MIAGVCCRKECFEIDMKIGLGCEDGGSCRFLYYVVLKTSLSIDLCLVSSLRGHVPDKNSALLIFVMHKKVSKRMQK